MIRVLLGFILIACAAFGAGGRVSAQAPSTLDERVGVEILGIVQEDTNTDGLPDITTIDANIVTDHDQVVVYDGNGNMQRSEAWWEATDFTDDTWVFDINADGNAQLIMRFEEVDGNAVAYLYDDGNGDGTVQYEVINNQVNVLESLFWTMRVEADGDWLGGDLTMNPNLTWIGDGCLRCDNLPESVRNLLTPRFARDGQPDFVGGVEDSDGDGVSDRIYSTMVTGIPLSFGLPRSSVVANESRSAPNEPQGFVFWPLLSGPNIARGERYFSVWPAIGMDWTAGRIRGGIGTSGYPTESGYHINSLSPWQADKTSHASFENPMAYYDLAGDQDGNPELHVRFEYEPDGFAEMGVAAEDVRYSWNQSNRAGLTWDYKVGLAGMNEIDTVIDYGPFSVYALPHEQVPGWVTSREWEWQTFVAVENRSYVGSEGIYEWSSLAGIDNDFRLSADDPDRTVTEARSRQRGYIAGDINRSPEDLYQSIGTGLRGEVSMRPGAKVYLYFSPIDARLHLLGASSGVYTIDDMQRVEYRNLNDDGYIDTWQHFEGDQMTAQLMQVGETVLYARDQQITLLQSDAPGEIFRTQPPTNNEEWLALGQQLEEHQSDVEASDLGAMFDQLSGERQTLTGGTMNDFRFTDSGYRFVLELQPGFDLGPFPIEGVSAPGGYIVEYDNDSDKFSATPTSQSALSIDSAAIPDSLTALVPVDLNFTLQNSGMEDATTVPLIITAQREGEQPVVISEQTVDLLGREARTIPVSWTARGQGSWSVTASAYPPGQERIEQTTTIDVQPQLQPDWQKVVASGWSQVSWPFYAAVLLGLITIPGAAGLLLIRRVR